MFHLHYLPVSDLFQHNDGRGNIDINQQLALEEQTKNLLRNNGVNEPDIPGTSLESPLRLSTEGAGADIPPSARTDKTNMSQRRSRAQTTKQKHKGSNLMQTYTCTSSARWYTVSEKLSPRSTRTLLAAVMICPTMSRSRCRSVSGTMSLCC